MENFRPLDIAPASPSHGRKALVVFSGGQDSTTCLFWAMCYFAEVEAVTFSYGQKHSSEIAAARQIAADNGVPWRLVDASFMRQLGTSSLTDETVEMDNETPAGGYPNTFVPGRNLFFLSMAAVIARERGITDLVTGVSQTDFSGYPDCRDTFIHSLNATINLAMDCQITIHTPLMWIDKAATWALADQLGAMDTVRRRTVTCYNGVPGDGCGHCLSCRLRQKGLEKYLKSKDE